jgi:hypothetical protein
MPKVYYVRDETGVDGPYYPTLKEAQSDFQWRCDAGDEPEGVHSLNFVPTRNGIAALLNSIRQLEP